MGSRMRFMSIRSDQIRSEDRYKIYSPNSITIADRRLELIYKHAAVVSNNKHRRSWIRSIAGPMPTVLIHRKPDGFISSMVDVDGDVDDDVEWSPASVSDSSCRKRKRGTRLGARSGSAEVAKKKKKSCSCTKKKKTKTTKTPNSPSLPFSLPSSASTGSGSSVCMSTDSKVASSAYLSIFLFMLWSYMLTAFMIRGRRMFSRCAISAWGKIEELLSLVKFVTLYIASNVSRNGKLSFPILKASWCKLLVIYSCWLVE